MNSNRVEAKWDVWLLAAAVALILLVAVLISCSDNAEGLMSPADIIAAGWGPDVEISSETVSHSDCKYFEVELATNDVPPTQSVVTWQYDGAGVLDLHHFNAGLNCCPLSFGEISVEDRTITVVQSDDGLCGCVCLFDIDYRVTGLPPGRYLLQIDEELLCGGDAPLVAEIMLKGSGSSGELAAARSCYPWGYALPVSGELVGNSGCGGYDADFLGEPPADSNCFIWEYADNTLSILHQSAVFNCCIEEMVIEFTFSDDTIYIDEDETYGELGGCACVCPYDVEMRINNLVPGVYTITLTGHHLYYPVYFEVDLTDEQSGYYCWAEAIEDPWGSH